MVKSSCLPSPEVHDSSCISLFLSQSHTILPNPHSLETPFSCLETHSPGETPSLTLQPPLPFPQPQTWKTLMRAWGKLSNVLRRTFMSSKSNLPPKSCMPSRAKTMMKRKRRRSREAMERTELSREATRLLKDVQYLGRRDTEACGR